MPQFEEEKSKMDHPDESDLQRLQSLRNNGYRLMKIHISFEKARNPSEVVELTLKKDRTKLSYFRQTQNFFLMLFTCTAYLT